MNIDSKIVLIRLRNQYQSLFRCVFTIKVDKNVLIQILHHAAYLK